MGDRDRQRQPEARAQRVAHRHRPPAEKGRRRRPHRAARRDQPVGRRRRGHPQPERPCPHRARVGGRRCCDHPAGRPDGRRDGAPTQQPVPDRDGRLVVGCAEDRFDVLPVASARDRTQMNQRRFQIRAVGRPVGGAGFPQHRGRAPQHPHTGRLHVPQAGARLVADPVGEPFEVLDDAHQRPTARRQSDRPEVGAEEALPQRQHRRDHVVAAGFALESVGERRDRVGGMPAQLPVVARRQEEQRRGHAHRERDRPAEQPLVDRSRRRARGQHERQQRRTLARRDRLAEHACEHHRHAEREHQPDRQPRVRRDQRPQRDQDRAVDAEAGVGQRAGLPVAGEVREHHQRERSEDREQRRLRIARDGEAERRGQRDDHRSPHRATQRVVLGIALANTVDRPANEAGRARPRRLGRSVR